MVGCVLTAAILIAVGVHLVTSTKCSGADQSAGGLVALLHCQSLADIGQWLSGVAGTLAFLWLIITYNQQGEELQLQRKQLKEQYEESTRQRAEMARQATAIEATQKLAKRESFFQFASFVIDLMNYDVVAVLKMAVSARHVADERSRWGRDDWAFYYEMLLDEFISREQKGILKKSLNENPNWPKIQSRITQFARRYQALLTRCDEVDNDRELRTEYEQSDQAQIYSAFSCIVDLPNVFRIRDPAMKCSDII